MNTQQDCSTCMGYWTPGELGSAAVKEVETNLLNRRSMEALRTHLADATYCCLTTDPVCYLTHPQFILSLSSQYYYHPLCTVAPCFLFLFYCTVIPAFILSLSLHCITYFTPTSCRSCLIKAVALYMCFIYNWIPVIETSCKLNVSLPQSASIAIPANHTWLHYPQWWCHWTHCSTACECIEATGINPVFNPGATRLSEREYVNLGPRDVLCICVGWFVYWNLWQHWLCIICCADHCLSFTLWLLGHSWRREICAYICSLL